MKEIKTLERIVSLICCVHLALMTLCLSLGIGLCYPGDDLTVCILWALGAVIPVQIIHQLCLRVKEQLPRVLLCILVAAIAVLVPDNGLRRFYYGLCCGIILISGLLIKWPHGRIVLTVPKGYHLFAAFLMYCFGKIIRSSVMAGLAIALFVLMTLTLCFYRNQEKVLWTLRDSSKEDVSRSAIIRLNRRVIGLFAALGILVLALVPWLLTWQGERVTPYEAPAASAAVITTTTEPVTQVTIPNNVVITDRGELISYDEVGTVMTWIFVAIIATILGIILFTVISDLLNIEGGNPRHTNPDQEQEWSLERLNPEELRPEERETAVGYDKKLRRRYQKLIRGRTPKNANLAPLTPTELERAAKLGGPGAETVHELYQKTRYSPEPATKETYTRFKEAAQSIPNSRDSEKSNGSQPPKSAEKSAVQAQNN